MEQNGTCVTFRFELCIDDFRSASAIADRLGTEFALIHRQRANPESSTVSTADGPNHNGTNGVNGFIHGAINGMVSTVTNGSSNGSTNGHVQDGTERMELLVGNVKDKVSLEQASGRLF